MQSKKSLIIFLVFLRWDQTTSDIIDPSTPIVPLKACGQLCDSSRVDAITPLSVDSDTQFLVLIIREHVCAWVLDLNNPTANRQYGRKHYFKYPRLQSLFTIFDDPSSSKLFNVTALFSSGMVGEVWRGVDGVIEKVSEGPLPLRGLGHNMLKTIDGSFGLQSDNENPMVRIIQSDYHMTYDLRLNKRVSGPDPLLKDYSYDFKKLGPIKGVFRRKNNIYFMADYYYYMWKSEDGKTGVLEEGKSITKDLYKCKNKFETPSTIAWPFLVPITTKGTPIPMVTDDYDVQINDKINTTFEANDLSNEKSEQIDDITTSKDISDRYYNRSTTGKGMSKTTADEGIDLSKSTRKSIIDDKTTSIADITDTIDSIGQTLEEEVTDAIESSTGGSTTFIDSADDNEVEAAIDDIKGDKSRSNNITSVSFLLLITIILMSVSTLIDHN